MGVNNPNPYDGGSGVPGTLTASQVCFLFSVPRKLTLPAGAPNSVATAGTAAAGSPAFSIQQNGVQVGTLNFSSNTIGSFTVNNNVSFIAGDVLSVIAPASPDANLANLSITFSLQRR